MTERTNKMEPNTKEMIKYVKQKRSAEYFFNKIVEWGEEFRKENSESNCANLIKEEKFVREKVKEEYEKIRNQVKG